jgi:hypothetical protein
LLACGEYQGFVKHLLGVQFSPFRRRRAHARKDVHAGTLIAWLACPNPTVNTTFPAHLPRRLWNAPPGACALEAIMNGDSPASAYPFAVACAAWTE